MASGDQDRLVIATVLQIGPDVKESFTVGQKVLVPPYQIGWIALEGRKGFYLDHEILGSFS